MPQVLKADVRARIVDAAAHVFAADGYRGAKVARIAERACLSTGNVYRYFSGKDALFDAVVNDAFVSEFESLLERRLEALASMDLRELDGPAREAAEHMLRFWIDNRLRVVILLDRADGSAYGDFRARFVTRLVNHTAKTLRETSGRRRLPRGATLTLRNIFEASRRSIVSILETQAREADIRLAFEAFWSFQLAGLEGFKGWVMR